MYANHGAVPTPPTTVTVTLPGGFATPVPGSEFPGGSALVTAPGAAVPVWNIPALPPGAYGYVSARVSLACPIGSLNTLSASALIVTPGCLGPDANPANNSHTFTAATTCAYDPNTKTVDPEGYGPSGRVLRGTEFTYRVDFQNTGSGPADEVLIRDYLDPDLDLGTVQFLGASHLAGLTVDPATRELTFRLPAIGLPAALHDEPGSHGFVLFRVKPLPGVPDNTRITNGAAIFFDANPAILTRVTLNTVVDSLTPPVTFNVAPATSIPGQAVQFTYPGPADADVTWSFAPDGTPATSTAPNPLVTFASAGTKQVSLSARYGGCPSASAGLAYQVRDAAACCDSCMAPFSARLTVTVRPGINYLVNPLCHGAANALGAIVSNPPDGTTLRQFDHATQTYGDPFTYDSSFGGWVDINFDSANGIALPPGEGFVLNNPGAWAFSLTFTGCEPDCPLPCPPMNGFALVGRTGSTTNAVRWEHLFNCPP